MNKEYNFLYKYLEKLEIFIDKNEFELQIQSHPDSPSLLAITDTLSFFNIENGVLQVDSSQIELLPDNFATILNEQNKDAQFYFVKTKGKKYIYESSNTISISKAELESRWSGIVLLIEKSEIAEITKINKWFRLFRFKDQSIRNYDDFKNLLLASNPIINDLEQSASILLGNTNARLKIILVTNPFSKYCKEAHLIMMEILQKYYDLVCFDIRFNFNNNEYSNKKSKKIHQQLVALYQNNGQKAFIDGLQNWFKEKDENKLYAAQTLPLNELEINEILDTQFNFNRKNDLIFTPQFVINQFVFPKEYDRKELIHFIKELSEDQYFQTV